MNDLQNKIWKEACEEEEKSKGYVSAELLLLPMLVKMAEEGKIEGTEMIEKFLEGDK